MVANWQYYTGCWQSLLLSCVDVLLAAGAVTVWNTKATFPYAPSSDLVVMVGIELELSYWGSNGA